MIRLTAVSVALASIVIQGAVAQLGAQEPRDTVIERGHRLAPIVITATRVAVPAVTAAATVIAGEDLRRRGITHVLDALREVPSAVVVRTGSYGGLTSLYLRGGESGYVRVLVDGVPINAPGGEFDYGALTTENVDRIEIVRGPASVLYGTDAVTGVIQIFTRAGDGPPRITAQTRVGTFRTLAASLGLEGGAGPARYGFHAGRYDTRGIYPFNNDYARTALSGHVALTADAVTDARFSVQYAEDDIHVPTDGAGNPVDRNAFERRRRVSAGVDLARRWGGRLTGRVAFAASDVDGGFDDRPDDAGDTLGFYAFTSLDHVQRRSVDARVDAALGGATVATVGAQAEEQRQRSFSASQSQFGPSNDEIDVRRRNGALYGQVVGSRGRVAWQVSARLDANDRFGTFGTARGGASVGLGAGWGARLAAGTAFREPTFFQNFAQGFARGNPDLDPERSRSWEVGLERRQLRDRLRLAATWFDQRFRGLIEYTGAPPTPTAPNFFNVAGATARGLELEAALDLPAGLAVTASYTRLRTRAVDAGFDTSATGAFRPGAPLLRRPDHAASLMGAWRPRGRIGLDVAARWIGARDDLDFASFTRVTLPGYAQLDAGAEVGLTRDGVPVPLRATLRVTNLLDADYEAVRGYRSPGRAFLAGVRVGQ